MSEHAAEFLGRIAITLAFVLTTRGIPPQRLPVVLTLAVGLYVVGGYLGQTVHKYLVDDSAQ